METDSVTHNHTELWQGVSSSGHARGVWRRTGLSGTRARAEGTAALHLCQAHLWGGLQTCAILPVLSSPHAWPILKLYWLLRSTCSTACLPKTPPFPTHKLPVVGLLPGRQPHQASYRSHVFMAGSNSQLAFPLYSLHIAGETFGSRPLVPA